MDSLSRLDGSEWDQGSKGRALKEPKEPVVFERIDLSEQAKPLSFFAKPEKAIFVEGKVQE